MHLFLLRCSLPVLTLFIASLAFAKAEAVGPGKLHIELVNPPVASGEKETKEFDSLWKKVCSALGAGFKVKKNYYFHGIANSHTCSVKSPKKSGGADATADWNLKIKEDKGVWSLEMFYKDAPVPEAKLAVPGGSAFLKAMADPTVAKLTAMELIDNLPMARQVDDKSIKTGLAYKKKKKSDPPKPVEEYNIFSLDYLSSSHMWIPKIIGKANLSKGTKAGSWKWDIKLDQPMAAGQTYWAQNSKGRGENKSIREKLGSELEKHGIEGSLFDDAANALYNTLASGYVGFRYGYPIVKGDSLIAKSSMVSIFTEVRGGPLEGLRWYWDFAPEIKEKVNGEQMSFTWSRPSLGWSFGMNFNWWLIDRVDVTPKLGLLDFDAKVPLDTDNGVIPVKFRLKNASNLGIELGAETNARWFLVRLWGASDASGLIDLGGSGSVTSLRAGLDTYWELYNINNAFKMSLVLFTYGEKLTLTKKESEQISGTNIKVEGISYNLGFVGAGLIFSW